MDWKFLSNIHIDKSRRIQIERGLLNEIPTIRKFLFDLSINEYNIAKREVKCLKSINDERIVKLYSYKKSLKIDRNGKKYNIEIFIEDLGFKNLAQYIRDNHQLDIDFIKSEMRELIHLFASLQKKRICHKDIRPENIMVHNGRLVVIDFSEGKQINVNNQPSFRGAIEYLSPEMILLRNEEIDSIDEFISDVWSLGLVFWKMIEPNHQKLNYSRCLQDNICGILKIDDQWIQLLLSQMLIVNQNERKDFIRMEEFMNSLCSKCGSYDGYDLQFLCRSCKN